MKSARVIDDEQPFSVRPQVALDVSAFRERRGRSSGRLVQRPHALWIEPEPPISVDGMRVERPGGPPDEKYPVIQLARHPAVLGLDSPQESCAAAHVLGRRGEHNHVRWFFEVRSVCMHRQLTQTVRGAQRCPPGRTCRGRTDGADRPLGATRWYDLNALLLCDLERLLNRAFALGPAKAPRLAHCIDELSAKPHGATSLAPRQDQMDREPRREWSSVVPFSFCLT